MRLIDWFNRNFRIWFILPGLAAIGVSTWFLFQREFFPAGWAVGVVLLAFSGKSSSEKRGYRV